jgi:sec-independent protein translocase protein TatA
MGPIGIWELLIILFIIVLLFGATRLPQIGGGLGKGIRNFKDAFREGDARDRDARDGDSNDPARR